MPIRQHNHINNTFSIDESGNPPNALLILLRMSFFFIFIQKEKNSKNSTLCILNTWICNIYGQPVSRSGPTYVIYCLMLLGNALSRNSMIKFAISVRPAMVTYTFTIISQYDPHNLFYNFMWLYVTHMGVILYSRSGPR